MRATKLLLAAAAVTLLPGCGASRTTAAPWNLRGPAAGDVLRLRIGIGSSSCDELHQVALRETDDEVRVTATVRRTDSKDCTGDYATVDRDVRLARPLGTRRLRGCRPEGPLTAGAFDGRETEDTCFETAPAAGAVGSG
jgi:hypothetical protein